MLKQNWYNPSVHQIYQQKMAWIALESMRFHSYHGVHPEEQHTGCEFVLDVFIKADTSAAAREDNVEKTVNYETVYRICQQEMKQPRKLIETVGQSIILQIKRQFPIMEAVRLKISKLNPPLGGRVGASSVELEETFTTLCPRCEKTKFSCFQNKDCWCNEYSLYSKTRQGLTDEFGANCLCAKCMTDFAG